MERALASLALRPELGVRVFRLIELIQLALEYLSHARFAVLAHGLCGPCGQERFAAQAFDRGLRERHDALLRRRRRPRAHARVLAVKEVLRRIDDGLKDARERL